MSQFNEQWQPPTVEAIAPQIVQIIPHLRLLVLFGSRATGTATKQSDWDLAFLADGSTPSAWGDLALYGSLASVLGISSDRIDLVSLDHCSSTLGYLIARDGKVLYEAEPNLFLKFQLKVWKVYADTAKLRRYQDDYIRQGLEKLKP